MAAADPCGCLGWRHGCSALRHGARAARWRIAIVSDARMRVINRDFLGHDYATDVLSFPADADVRAWHGALGDLVIARGVAERQAREAGHAVGTEFKVLALHGLLHLLGYDHDTDDGTMRRAEARLRRKAGLTSGLIERAAR